MTPYDCQTDIGTTLQELAARHRAAKRDAPVAHYLSLYEDLLGSRRDTVRRLLEIGVHSGGSLRMWADFFPHADIHGLDCDPRCRRVSGDRIAVHIGRQEDPEFLAEEIAPHGLFDLIIDDGGHRMDEQRTSLQHLWPSVIPGGLYVIEDLHTSYVAGFGGRDAASETMVDFLKQLIDGLNHAPVQLLARNSGRELLLEPPMATLPDLRAITFFGCLCVLHKQPLPPPTPPTTKES